MVPHRTQVRVNIGCRCMSAPLDVWGVLSWASGSVGGRFDCVCTGGRLVCGGPGNECRGLA